MTQDKDMKTEKRMDKRAYQHWYYETIRKKNKKDLEYKRSKEEIIKSLTFKVTVSRCPDELVVFL